MTDKLEVQDQQYQVVAKATISVQLAIDIKARSFTQAAYQGMGILADKIWNDIDFKDVQYLSFDPACTFVEQIIDGKVVDSGWVLGHWGDDM